MTALRRVGNLWRAATRATFWGLPRATKRVWKARIMGWTRAAASVAIAQHLPTYGPGRSRAWAGTRPARTCASGSMTAPTEPRPAGCNWVSPPPAPGLGLVGRHGASAGHRPDLQGRGLTPRTKANPVLPDMGALQGPGHDRARPLQLGPTKPPPVGGHPYMHHDRHITFQATTEPRWPSVRVVARPGQYTVTTGRAFRQRKRRCTLIVLRVPGPEAPRVMPADEPARVDLGAYGMRVRSDRASAPQAHGRAGEGRDAACGRPASPPAAGALHPGCRPGRVCAVAGYKCAGPGAGFVKAAPWFASSIPAGRTGP